MILAIMFILTGLTILVDIAMLTVMWLMNMNVLKDIKKHLTNEEEEKELKMVVRKDNYFKFGADDLDEEIEVL